MSRSGLKWPAVGVACLLVVLGAHLAWERHRYRLHTPRGTIRIGMTLEEAARLFGPEPPQKAWLGGTQPKHANWFVDGTLVAVDFYDDERIVAAETYRLISYGPPLRFKDPVGIPRPSLFEAARSWLTGWREED
jgi:hypothetical protein